MMTSPKLQFQKDSERRAMWQGIASSPVAQQAMVHALAELSLRVDSNAESLAGARRFAAILFSLSEDEPKIEALPIRQLKSFDPAPPSPTPKKQ